MFGPDTFFSGAICFDFHPTDHPMDDPRIILPISEPDRDDAIILASSQGLVSEAITPYRFFHAIILVSSYGFRVKLGSLMDHHIIILPFGTVPISKSQSSYCHPTVFGKIQPKGGMVQKFANLIIPISIILPGRMKVSQSSWSS